LPEFVKHTWKFGETGAVLESEESFHLKEAKADAPRRMSGGACPRGDLIPDARRLGASHRRLEGRPLSAAEGRPMGTSRSSFPGEVSEGATESVARREPAM
jgi:hypothetical protein